MDILINKLWACINELAGGKYTVFANKAGIGANTVKAWLLGQAQPRKKSLKKLLAFTKKSEEYFYLEEMPYPITPEHMIGREETPPGEPVPGSYGIPDMGKLKVVKTVEKQNLLELFKNQERAIAMIIALAKLERLDSLELDLTQRDILTKIGILERFKKNKDRT